MEMPLVSIILPVYNAQSHLNRCLGSICAQQYEDLEIIVINSASILLNRTSLPSINFIKLFSVALYVSLVRNFPDCLRLAIFTCIKEDSVFLPEKDNLLLLTLVDSTIILVFKLILFFCKNLKPR